MQPQQPALLPTLVKEALARAAAMDFPLSCSAQTGQLLQTLAATITQGVVGEMGAGCGVGAAWILSGLQPSVPFVTVENDPERARAVSTLFAGRPNVRVIGGDWREILPYGPFALLFVDAGPPKRDHPEKVLDVLAPGGLLVLDDLTPGGLSGEASDPVRDFWLHHREVIAAEVMVRPQESVILAARRLDV